MACEGRAFWRFRVGVGLGCDGLFDGRVLLGCGGCVVDLIDVSDLLMIV